MFIKTARLSIALLLVITVTCSCKSVNRTAPAGENLSNDYSWSNQYIALEPGGPFDHLEALDESHVWAFRSPSEAYFFDGTGWSQNHKFYPDFSDRMYSYAFDVKHIWLSVSDPNYSIIYFYNGEEWVQQHNFESEVDGEATIDGIDGLDSEHVWAYGTIPGSKEGKIFFFDGTSWQKTLETEGIVFNVVPVSDHEVWAVISRTLYSFDGTEWIKQGFNEGSIDSIYLSEDNHMWATDSSGNIFRLDGDEWETAFAAGDEVSLYVLNDSCVWAITRNGNLTYYDGSSWESKSIGDDFVLKDMEGYDPRHVWAVGHNSRDEGIIYFFDGNTWEPQYITQNDVFVYIAVLNDNNIWVLGLDTIFYGAGTNSE